MFIGMLILCVGLLAAIVGSIWFIVVAFQESVLWGLGCLLLQPLSIIFLLLHFGDAARPFGLSLLGSVLMLAGNVLMPEAAAM